MPVDSNGRDTILEVAARLFSEKGYTGVSIRDIAQDCGMTNAALYYHFKNKDDLYLTVLRRNYEQVIGSLADFADADEDMRARLKQLVLRYTEVMCEQRQSFQMMRRDIAHIDDARAGKLFAEMRSGFLRPIQELIESGQSNGQIVKGNAQFFARLLHGMIIALTFEGKLGRQTRVSTSDAETLVDVFLKGVERK